MRLMASATFRPRGDLGRWVETNITPAVINGVKASCELVQKSAQALCPVATGALKASITTEIDDSGKTVVGRVSPHTFYAPYVEFGTGIRGAASPGAGPGPYALHWAGMVAQPYMRPALDESRRAVLDTFRGEIALALR